MRRAVTRDWRGGESFMLGVTGQELQRDGDDESSRSRFALVLCITICIFYAKRQAHRRQPQGICSQHRTKSRITMRAQSGLGHSDGELHMSTSTIGSKVFFMKPPTASVFHAHRTARFWEKTTSQLDHICPLSEVIRMSLMFTSSYRVFLLAT